MSDLESLEPVVNIDAHKFTDTEKELILQVIKRDEDVRIQEKSRIEHLKEELKDLREKGVPEGYEQEYGRVCQRCRTPLGLIFNSGALCPNCDKKVCKTCRVSFEKSEDEHSWLCTVCSKIRDIRAESGAWFYDGGSKQGKKKKVYGSFLVKKMFSKARRRDTVIFNDPNWTDIIEKDEPIPEEDEVEDSKYLVISSANQKGEFLVQEGNNIFNSAPGGGAVVEVNNPPSLHTMQTTSSLAKQQYTAQQTPPLLLLTLAKKNDTDSSSEVIFKAEEINKEDDEMNKKLTEPTTKAQIYYDPEQDSTSSSEEDNDILEEDEIIEEEEEKNDDGVSSEIKKGHIPEQSNSEEETDEKLVKLALVGDEEHQEQEIIPQSDHHEQKVDIEEEESIDDINISLAAISGHEPKEHTEEDKLEDLFNEFKDIKEEDTESIGSYMSDDDAIDDYVSVAGEILIGLKFDHDKKSFEVQVHRAKDLVAADKKKNTADPYVKVYLKPDIKKGGKRKTKAKRNSLNPDFDEVLEFKNIPYEELISRTCSISVWHNDSFDKNLHLGEANINIEEYLNSGFTLEEPSPHWYTLCARHINQEEVAFVGELEVRISYKAPVSQVADSKKEQKKLPNPTKGSLEGTVIGARNMNRLNQETDVISSYCKINLLSSTTSYPRFRTNIMKHNIEPTWNAGFIFNNVSWTELQSSALQISMHDKTVGFLGGFRLGTGKLKDIHHDSFGEEVEVWSRILDQPNQIIHYNVPLRSTLHSIKKDSTAPPVQVKIITDDEHDVMKKKQKKELSGSQPSLAKRLLNADTISLASSGSMLSLYSMAGGEHHLIITGELLFSIKHNVDSGIFSIHIEKAKGIAAVDVKKQASDPYIKTYLLPDKLKTSKKKTTHKRKTINPQWNETIKYKLSREELLTKTLQVSIWNHDRFGRNDFLGEVQVNLKHYENTNNLDSDEAVWYTLQEAAPVSVGAADDNKGEVVCAIKFDRDRLTVQIKEAHGLYASDDQHLPSPFVKCYLLPDKSRRGKRKTSVQKKTIHPVWTDKFEFRDLLKDDLHARVLEVTIWDYNSSGHQFLGGLRLGLAYGDEYWHDCFNKEVHIWEAMMKHLGIFAEYTIPLRATMTSRKGQEPVEIPMITQQKSIQLDSQLLDVPHLRLNLQYSKPDFNEHDEKKKKKTKGELKVYLKEARHLPLTHDDDLPSTFIKALLHPKKKGQKYQSDVYMKSVNPLWEWEATFEDVSLDDLREKTLEIGIYEESKGKKGELIGFARLGSGGHAEQWEDSSGLERELWFSMLNNPNQWNNMSIPLRIEKREPEETAIEVKKEKVKPEKSKNENEDSEEELEENYQENNGSESPRTIALRAMGVHATNVIDIMQNSGDPTEQQIYQPPQESLTMIVEEESDLETSGSISKSNVPNITITNEVKPGDPPFVSQKNDIDDDFISDYPPKKKLPPAMSLLKRSTSRESLTSVYSTDSAYVYGQIPIHGDIQFGMKYDNQSNTFEVHVFQAKDISAVDLKKQQSDVFCKTYLLPDKTKYSKKKTKTRKKTLNPEWEEILQYKISLRDLRTRTLWLALWHKERMGRNIFLGEVMLNLDHVVDEPNALETPIPKWYTLCEKGTAPMTEIFKGELVVALMFEDPSLEEGGTQHGKEVESGGKEKKKKKKKEKKKSKNLSRINVHIKAGVDLPAADSNGTSDPFCKCYLIPSKSSKSKRKTPVIRSTCQPAWDYRTEYDMDFESLDDNGIEFTIWDSDRGTKNDFLGCARINLGMRSGRWDDAEGVEIEAWRHLINEPNKWKEFTIPLRSKMDFRPSMD